MNHDQRSTGLATIAQSPRLERAAHAGWVDQKGQAASAAHQAKLRGTAQKRKFGFRARVALGLWERMLSRLSEPTIAPSPKFGIEDNSLDRRLAQFSSFEYIVTMSRWNFSSVADDDFLFDV